MATVSHLGLLPSDRGCYPEKPSFLQGGLVYPPLSLEDATKAVWRVSRWGFSRPNNDFNGNPQPEYSLQQQFESERNLVCNYPVNAMWGGFDFVPNGILSYFIQVLSPFTYQEDGLYYVLTLRQQLGGELAGSFVYNGNLSFTISAPSGYSTDFFPAEYWPYDPNDGGGPIYDSTTGAQLRSFP